MTDKSKIERTFDVERTGDPQEGRVADTLGLDRQAGTSVLKSLSKQLPTVPHVALRETDQDKGDATGKSLSQNITGTKASRTTAADSRYEVLSEIARGGMGAILKGRDTDLGRALAIKVLLDEHKDDPQVVERFIEEAQIGGQLQHPGIVPVYELGQFSDQRPFFSMKLVRGETLTSLLDKREALSDELPKMLGIFQQVCLTIAYAHSKGVIHRDLKPLNVMVGAFGEVQVMDWGLAKVLTESGYADEPKTQDNDQHSSVIHTRRSIDSGVTKALDPHTQMGSVMGTAAYMPPEQALGEVDRVDERADVFGLGAILCEIVTGQPPYVGANNTEVFRQACRGQLDDCFARLDKSGLDQELVQLAKQSLAPELKDRLRDATAVTEGLTNYLNGVQERLKKAELAKVEAEARAEFEAQQRAAETVNAVVTARPSNVLDTIAQLPALPITAESLARFAAENPHDEYDKRQLHARLALVESDGAHVPDLLKSLLCAEPEYVSVIREALDPHKDAIATDLWNSFYRGSDESRFRAGIALAKYFPESERWEEMDLSFLAEQLVLQRSDDQRVWRDAVRPLLTSSTARAICLDRWEQLFRDSSPEIQLNAARALEEFASSEHRRFARLLSLANPEQFPILFKIVEDSPQPELIRALARIAANSPQESTTSQARIELGRRRGGAGIALLRLRSFEAALPTLDYHDDPEAMTQFIHGCHERGVSAVDLLKCLAISECNGSCNDHVRYALTLALADYPLTDVPESDRKRLLEALEKQYQSHPSSAVHSATGWLLTQWAQDEAVRRVDQTPVKHSRDREWFTLEVPSRSSDHAFFLTFVVFESSEVQMGAVQDEPDRSGNESRHLVRIGHRFAVLDRQVCCQELMDCNPEHESTMTMFTGTSETAGPGTMWYDSIQFCRWLTDQIGLSEDQQAYAAPDSLEREKYPHEPTLSWAPQHWPVCLEREGFRLPTEAEWEYACRAGTRTAFSFGGDAELLGHYAWFATNSSKRVHRPKERRPNPRGLFDMHGNLFEWCHDWMGPYGTDAPLTDPTGPPNGKGRVLRGGCWGVLPAFCRSSNRISMPPSTNFIFEGLRLCVTLPGDEVEPHSDSSEPRK